MNTQDIPVRGGGPDEARGTVPPEIDAASYLSLWSDDAIGRMQTDTGRLSQPPNDTAVQILPASRFAVGRPLERDRWDSAWGAR